MKENEHENPQDLGQEMYDTSELEIGADEPAMEEYFMEDSAAQDVDSIVQEVMASMDAQNDFSEQSPEEEYQEYSDEYEETSPDEEEDDEYESLRKDRRPRRKKIKKKGTGLFGIPHFISGLILAALVLFIGVTAARVGWLWADDLLALTKEDRVVTVTITDSDTMNDIAQKLADAGLVRYPMLFNAYCKLTDAREKISAGEFQINEMYDYHALVSSMSSYSSNRKEIEVMIPEGYECKQIFSLLEKNEVCTVEELEEAAKTIDLSDFEFLDGLSEEDRKNPYCLEGFMFPDTYNFYMSDDPERVLRKFLRNFDYRFDDELLDGIQKLNSRMANQLAKYDYSEEYIKENYLTIKDVVIVASMIERETAYSGESATIASVIYNRLANPDMSYLQIDATIQYALGERKEKLSLDDLEIDSPYNTYRNTGLPIGPISNPGMNSLKAAIWPEDTDYYYYALDTDGIHHFSETYAEHQDFLAGLSEGD